MWSKLVEGKGDVEREYIRNTELYINSKSLINSIKNKECFWIISVVRFLCPKHLYNQLLLANETAKTTKLIIVVGAKFKNEMPKALQN